ncbi:MAG: calcium/sodium antiporter [Tenericutes bacterium]|nr:calcium/sodium antiporter [Mycoplasmatota bacterium]MDD6942295.1 calcium/sodium antiporter [bacterium]MDY2696608.1 calcium/sodium antiporter [Bacilli bacterium]
MVLNIILLIIGFVILIKGADLFVDGASNIALNFKVSKMLIGLTIVAFGTSAPEFAVSVKGLLSGSFDIVLGNVIGSNILNILLILGVAAMIHPLVVKSNTVKKELPITLLITALFAVLLSDNLFDKSMSNNFTRGDGIVLILFFLVFIYYLINLMRNKVEDSTDEKVLSLPKSFLYTFIGLVMIILGSNFVVDSASYLAKAFGVSERIISLTIIALGTSLPELVTSVMATKKGEYDIAIGNAVGSNIFNIGIVIGLPVTILGGISKIAFSYIDLIVMVVTALMLYLFSKNDYKISKREGLSFLILFVVYYSYVILG